MRHEEVIQELHHDGAQELLQSGSLARLAYTGRDGHPRVIPIGFYWNGEHLVVCTAPAAPKVSALRERPEVAVTIDTEEPPPKSLLVRGITSIEVVDGVPPEYLYASSKSMEGDELKEFQMNVRSVYERMARISIIPMWARFFDFGAGRVPAFLRELASGP